MYTAHSPNTLTSLKEEIIKGLANKQPKIVVACIEVLRMGLE